MASHAGVFNETRGFWMSYKRAVSGIRQFSLVWVEDGAIVRDLNLEESRELRKAQAKHREWICEPLPHYELFGTRFKQPIGYEKNKRQSNMLVWAACQFAAEKAVKA